MLQTWNEHGGPRILLRSPERCPAALSRAYSPHDCSVLGHLFFLDHHMNPLHLFSLGWNLPRPHLWSQLSEHEPSHMQLHDGLPSVFSIQHQLSTSRTIHQGFSESALPLDYFYWFQHLPNHFNPKPGNLSRKLLFHPHSPLFTYKVLRLLTISVPDYFLLLYHCPQPQSEFSLSFPCSTSTVRVVSNPSFVMLPQNYSQEADLLMLSSRLKPSAYNPSFLGWSSRQPMKCLC